MLTMKLLTLIVYFGFEFYLLISHLDASDFYIFYSIYFNIIISSFTFLFLVVFFFRSLRFILTLISISIVYLRGSFRVLRHLFYHYFLSKFFFFFWFILHTLFTSIFIIRLIDRRIDHYKHVVHFVFNCVTEI